MFSILHAAVWAGHHYDIVEPIDCDQMRIGQLLSNLLGNALTHGVADVPVRIDATTADGKLTIAVSNGGTLLFSDIDMPGSMDGLDLAHRVKLMTILTIALGELNEELGNDIEFIEPGTLIGVFTRVVKDLTNHVANRDLFAETWLNEKSSKVDGARPAGARNWRFKP